MKKSKVNKVSLEQNENKNIVLGKDGLYKVSGILNDDYYFTVLTEKEKECITNREKVFSEGNNLLNLIGEKLEYSPNNEYIFKNGLKFEDNKFISCALAIRLEDYKIVEAMKLPERDMLVSTLQMGINDFKEAARKMVEQNPEMYDEIEMEK